MPIKIEARPSKKRSTPTGMADRKMKMAAKMRGGKVATKKMRGGGKMKVAAKRKGGRLY